MAKAKLAVTFDEETLAEVDLLVKQRLFPNRSRVIEEAVVEKLARMKHNRLARECALLDPIQEKAIAEEGMGEEIDQWPEY
ncbi:CopG family ribbon-helix-helix protein [Geotalea toluenoxydans]|uniref:CopG family ribbon-helix-helix protein n=1 Tax=Geotalea toluenoxydans TaxID=421624 RepID=UPI0006D21CF5|nr:ribbon-helix-helix domain-containing protein [Geotalea toluenoxydans]